MKELIFILFLSFTVFACQKQVERDKSDNYQLIVTLENAPFDSLYLLDRTNGRNISIASEKIDSFVWIITIPDSIAQTAENMSLEISKFDTLTNSLREIRFMTEKNEQLIPVGIGVENQKNFIHATYLKPTIYSDEYLSVKIGDKDSIILGNNICEDFKLILKNDSSDITVRAQEPLFSWFQNYKNKNISYEEYLKCYIELSKRYPDSRFLMCNLSLMVNRYKTKKDVQTVYNNLSNKHKNTHWAKRIERYLANRFSNTSLPNSGNNTYENIIQDSSKYNLVVFTASWCGYCIQEIPLLKKIYKDLNKNLILTYISIDEENTLEAFQKQIQEKKIPWRSLLAYKNTQKIRDKYFVDGVPYCLLVYPNGNMKEIDIRNPEELKKMYSICSN